MPGRHTESTDYRYAYNGMETDNEVKGNGNSYTTEFRQYDPRLGRWLSLDPLKGKYTSMSPYSTFNNNPIYFVDPLGLEGGPAKEKLEFPKVEATPSGGSVTLPAGAMIIERYDNTKYYEVNEGPGNTYNHYAEPGSVKAFEFRNITYHATYSTATGNFIGYTDLNDFSQSGLTSKRPAISFGTGPIVTSEYWGTDTENGTQQAAMMGTAVLGNPFGKTPHGIISGFIMTVGAYTLGSVILHTETWDFALTNESIPAIETVDAVDVTIQVQEATKVKDLEPGDIVPTPETDKEAFERRKNEGDTEWVNKETGDIWSRSKTSHRGEKWKVWPKGTKGRGKTPDRRNVGEDGTIRPGN